jgi:phytoene synthase
VNDAAFASHVEDWRRRRPELALALPYLDPAEHDALTALACIEQQWLDAVYGIGESRVAEAKLAWWAEEIARARHDDARHPLGVALFALPRARALPESLWSAPLTAGMARREASPAADFAQQLHAAETFHAALARLENAIWFGAGTEAARATRLSVLGHLLDALSRFDTGAADALPMNLLARHALDRNALATESTARDAAVRDQLSQLQSAHADAASLPGPVTLFRSLAANADLARLRRALRARRPLAALAVPAHPGPAMAWQAWRAARRLRRDHPRDE